jgi:hypothetical protein
MQTATYDDDNDCCTDTYDPATNNNEPRPNRETNKDFEYCNFTPCPMIIPSGTPIGNELTTPVLCAYWE